MKIKDQIEEALRQKAIPEKAAFFPRFFKTGKGEYGEGDRFLGVTVPEQRIIAKKYWKDLPDQELEIMIKSPFHEVRLTSILILVLKFQKATRKAEKKSWVDFYLKNRSWVNNWDLVDSSAHLILGDYLFDKDRSILYDLAKSGILWDQRIAIMSTFYFIRKKDFGDTLKIAEILLHHPHDLIHKAVGWMIREVGNRDFETANQFLLKHYQSMPRTMLRYAIEKFDVDAKAFFMKKD
ncbi:DNA alkylation repair protein [Aquiflexum gelatinilyticum]|uniref:DNA alkylation repair protein n=1 Tax=Aquiflexum gelatinilyticum TaxID=2961943 RepID=UPI002168CAE7|nr:DNA alkylation repair protein [Aquiflexum gelatinilyticum]MCS4435103.1 DNA alkylation repair protein [Aquiflexum gelatinilyticum]